LVICLIFLPSVIIPYAHHDNARYFTKLDGPVNMGCREDQQYEWLRKLGRPLAAEVECRINFFYIDKIGDLSFLKAIAVSLVVLSAWVLIHIFYSGGLGFTVAGILSVLLVSLPGVQNAVMMANLVNCITLLLVVFAASLHGREYVRWPTYFFNFLILMLGFQLYPAWCFIFPIILCFYGALLTRNGMSIKSGKLFGGISLFFGVSIVSLLLRKIFIDQTTPEAYAADISIAMIVRIIEGGLAVVVGASKLWYLYLPIVSYIFLLLLSVIWIFVIFSRFPRRIIFYCVFCALGGLGFGLLPWAIPKFSMSFLTRVIYPLSFALILAFALGVAIISRKISDQSAVKLSSIVGDFSKPFARQVGYSILIIFAVTATLAANYSATISAWSSNMEIEYLIQNISKADIRKIRRIHVVRPSITHQGYNRLPWLGDDFNGKTSSYYFDVANFVNVGLRELGINRFARDCSNRDSEHWKCLPGYPVAKEILVTQGELADQVCFSDDLLVIDFSMLDHAAERDGKSYERAKIIQCTSWADRLNVVDVSDDKLVGAWHTSNAIGEIFFNVSNLILENERGEISKAILTSGRIDAVDWHIYGYVTDTGTTIQWSNGTTWSR